MAMAVDVQGELQAGMTPACQHAFKRVQKSLPKNIALCPIPERHQPVDETCQLRFIWQIIHNIKTPPTGCCHKSIKTSQIYRTDTLYITTTLLPLDLAQANQILWSSISISYYNGWIKIILVNQEYLTAQEMHNFFSVFVQLFEVICLNEQKTITVN